LRTVRSKPAEYRKSRLSSSPSVFRYLPTLHVAAI
jgi:hypothetical protein